MDAADSNVHSYDDLFKELDSLDNDTSNNNFLNMFHIFFFLRHDNIYEFIIAFLLLYLSIYVYYGGISNVFFSNDSREDDVDDNPYDSDIDDIGSRNNSSSNSNFFKNIYNSVASPFSESLSSPKSRHRVKNVVGKPYINGSCGLINLGNTCYINSTMQCLSAIPEFRRIFLNPDLKKYINFESRFGTKGKLALAVGELLHEMWGDEFTAVAPIKFRETIVTKYKMFGGTEHQDSHEFLTTLIDNLHEDLNCAKHSKYRLRGSSFDHLNAHERSVRTLAEYKLSNRSPLMDVFLGQIRSTVTCRICSHSNPSFDTFWQISLPLPPPSIFINVKVFPCQINSEPVLFGFWIYKNPEISSVSNSVVNMIAEQYGRDTRVSNTILCTVAQDGTNAPLDVCMSSEQLKRLCGGEMLYAFEMDDSIYKARNQHSGNISTLPDEDGEYHDGGRNCEYNGTFVPFVHRVYKECNGGKYSIVGRPGLVFIPHDCRTVEFNKRICYEVLKSVDLDMIEKDEGDLVPSCDNQNLLSMSHFEGSNGDYLLQLLRYGILRVVSSNSLLWRRGLDVPEGDEIVHTWLPSRKMHIIFDWYEDSIYNEGKATSTYLHTTFKHRPNTEDSRSSISLLDCFHHYTKTEDSLEYHCSECKIRVQAKKDLKFVKLPSVLVILLKRFESDLKKITSNVEFPVNGLDMRPYVCENFVVNNSDLDDNEYMYDLVALSTHVGSLSSGHYTAYTSLGDDEWIFFNDEKINPLRLKQLQKNLNIDTSSVYMLVYRKRMFSSNHRKSPHHVFQQHESNHENMDNDDDALRQKLRPSVLSTKWSTEL